MIIVPSLLNANTYKIISNLSEVKKAGVNYLHIDVMDGHFVPNQAFGANTVNDLKKETGFILDVHLMIENPEKYLFDYKNADIITIHAEATNHLYRCVQIIKDLGVKAGVAINPGTPVSAIGEVLPLLDQVLVMTINPGVSGQSFIEHSITKIDELSTIKTNNNYNYDIQVDGNITDKTIKRCLKAGANIFVSGGFVFNGDSIETQIMKLFMAGSEDEC